MNSFVLRVGGAASALMAVGLLAVPATLAADNTCTITGNGARSHNRCRIKVVNKSATIQINAAKVKNNVGVISNTGLNNASGNTGGSVTVVSGSSNVNISITNNVNGGSTP